MGIKYAKTGSNVLSINNSIKIEEIVFRFPAITIKNPKKSF
jgi:hypothetical protein